MLDRVYLESHMIPDKFVLTTNAALTMTPDDQIVRAISTGGTSFTITLPKVTEARGKVYTIIARTVSGGGTITVAHAGDSEAWSNVSITSAGKHAFYSDGLAWFKVA